MLPLFKKKEKFIIVLGEDGAVLTHISGKTLLHRVFASSASPVERKEFDTILAQSPHVPIYVLIDSMDQNLVRQVLPAVSALSIAKLVKRRLERDYAENDIKGGLFLERVEAGRRDWVYMFMSVPQTDNIAKWIDYFISLSNEFAGIYMLPLEMQSLYKTLEPHLFPASMAQKPADWQLLITHNKTGGFRQIVLHNKRVIFTRMIRSDKETKADIIAGNIEQEALNTVDYLRRLAFTDDDQIDLITITSQEIQQHLQDIILKGRKGLFLTPFEVCNKLGYEGVSSQTDKFADLLLATSFGNNKPVLKLFTPQTQLLNNLNIIYSTTRLALLVILPMMGLYMINLVYMLIQENREITRLSNEKIQIESQWKSAQQTNSYDLKDADKITDAVILHNSLVVYQRDPLEIIRSIYNVQQSNAMTVSFGWNYGHGEMVLLTNENEAQKQEIQKKGRLTATFNLRYYNTGNNIEELFDNFDQFSKNLASVFADYEIEHTKLPEKISFGDKADVVDIQLILKSKTVAPE